MCFYFEDRDTSSSCVDCTVCCWQGFRSGAERFVVAHTPVGSITHTWPEQRCIRNYSSIRDPVFEMTKFNYNNQVTIQITHLSYQNVPGYLFFHCFWSDCKYCKHFASESLSLNMLGWSIFVFLLQFSSRIHLSFLAPHLSLLLYCTNSTINVVINIRDLCCLTIVYFYWFYWSTLKACPVSSRLCCWTMFIFTDINPFWE